jgi:hypothetical protein
MNKRWSFYLLAGVLFGIFDFYFQTWINQLFAGTPGNAAMMVPILGVWLVLVAPIALREAKASRSVWLAAAASAFTWSVSVVAYYLFMGAKLILIGQASRAEMHISNRSDPYYWSNIKNFFVGDLLGGVGEWIIVALVGGCFVGLVVGFLTLRAQKKRQYVV